MYVRPAGDNVISSPSILVSFIIPNNEGTLSLTCDGPYVQPSYATTDRGRIRGHKFDRPLLEVARGRRPYVMLSPISERVLIEVAVNWVP